MSDVPLPSSDKVDIVREARVYGQDPADGSYVPLEVDSNGNLNVDATVSSGDVDVTDRASRVLGRARLVDSDGNLIDPATDTTLSSTLSREIASWTAGTLPVEQQTPVGLEDSSGTQVEPATDTTLTNTLSREIASWTAGTLAVEQQTPVGLEDSSGTQVEPLDRSDMDPIAETTTATGASNAAQLDLGPHRKDVDVYYDTSGSATVTIEVSTDAATWRQLHVESVSSASTEILQFETSYRYIRTYVDSNLNTAEIAAKGD